MRYLLIILLSFVSFTACAQIRARQIRVDSNYADLQVIVNDTTALSSTYRLGKFRSFFDLITDYLDSLGIKYPSDLDWIKSGTSDSIPDNNDDMYHIGKVVIGDTAVITDDAGLTVVGKISQYFPTRSIPNVVIGDGAGGSTLAGGNVAIGDSTLANAGASAVQSLAIGSKALTYATQSRFNTAVGMGAMQRGSGSGPSGGYSTAVGHFSQSQSTSAARYNTSVGAGSLTLNTSGDNNVAIGGQAGASATGSSNTYIGYQSGFTSTGSSNVFVGNQSGYNETGSNKLYIDNSNTASPLIKGDFAADTLHVHGRLGYSTDAGNPDVLTGLDGRQFTTVYLGYGLDFSNDTLKVDTTEVGGGSGGGGGTNLSIDGGGPSYLIASSTGNDVVIDSDLTIDLSEPGTDTLRFKVDTTVIATLYDLTTLDTDDDWYIVGTTDEPTAITDSMYHTGITAIGESVGSQMYGQLTIGNDNTGQLGIAINGYPDSNAPFLGVYPLSDSGTGWEFAIEDDNSLFFRHKYAGTPTIPFSIEPFSPTATLLLQGTGDVLIGNYPNTRDDGTASNFLGTDASGVIQSYDIDDVISEWLLAATGTPGTEAITDGETVTFSAAGAATVARSGSTITYTVTEGDGSTTNEAWTIDATGGDTELISNQTVLFAGAGIASTSYNAAANTLTITATEVDGSTTNELQTVQENDGAVTNGTNINTFDFGTLFDVTAAAGEANIDIDLGEATTVTTAEADDYVIMYDNGSAVEQKILVTDLADAITAQVDFFETNPPAASAYEGTGYQIDFLQGIDLTMVGVQADVSLDFSEFPTDAAPEGDEFVILSDGVGIQEKVAITYFTGLVDFNFAEDNLTFTGNRSHDMGIYNLTLHGDVNNVKFLDDNGGTGDNIIIASELGAGTGVTGGISFEYENGGAATDQFDIEANKRSSTKQTLEIQAEQDTDAAITYEKNSGLADNTTESHLAINGGIAFTQNYEWTGTAADLTLDRSYHIVNVSGSGAIGDEINLPEVISNNDNWQSTMADAQVQVGQEYVITNWRASTNLVIRAFSGDKIVENDGTAVVDSYELGDLESVIIKCVRLNAGVGYWVIYK